MIQLAIAGALGRTGRRVLELAMGDPRFHVAAAITSSDCSDCGTTVRANGKEVRIVARLTTPCRVLVDFTTTEGTQMWLTNCVERKVAMVIGTTGHSESTLQKIRDASRQIPIVFSANFSIGVEVVRRALQQLVHSLGPNYDVEIVETHHRNKVDAPSGTALMLAAALGGAMQKAIGDGRGNNGGSPVEDVRLMHGRRGAVGPRGRGEVGIHAIRMGDVVGRHEIHFGGPGETITIAHEALSRDTFAAGALRAAAWLVDQPPGLYTMANVVG